MSFALSAQLLLGLGQCFCLGAGSRLCSLHGHLAGSQRSGALIRLRARRCQGLLPLQQLGLPLPYSPLQYQLPLDGCCSSEE